MEETICSLSPQRVYKRRSIVAIPAKCGARLGESAREANVFALLSALEQILPDLGYEVATGASLSAAQRALVGYDDGGVLP